MSETLNDTVIYTNVALHCSLETHDIALALETYKKLELSDIETIQAATIKRAFRKAQMCRLITMPS